MNWISRFAGIKPTDVGRSESQNDPTLHIDLLQRYLKVMPFLVLEPEFVTPSLLHMDLHMGNIFVHSAVNPKILKFQPFYISGRYSHMIDYDTGEDRPMELNLPAYLEGYDEMDEKQKMVAKSNRAAKMVKRYWLLQTLTNNPRLGQLFFKLPQR